MRRITVLIGLVLCAGSLHAQTPVTGFPPFGSFDTSGFDGINRQNLNVNFSLPVVVTPGRGLNFGMAIAYNSLVWQKVTSGSTTSWTSVTDASGNPTWGWQEFTPRGMIKFKTTSNRCRYLDPNTGLWGYAYWTLYSGYAYVDSAGTPHPFPIAFSSTSDACGTTLQPASGYATDNSGYLAQGNGPYSVTVTSPNGIQVTKDTNGNYISSNIVSSAETDWTDTAGHLALKVINNGSNVQYQWQDTTGTYRTTSLLLSTFNIQSNFGCSGVVEYTGTANLPTEMDLPNGQKYLFTYEATPGYSGYITGRVQRVTLPTGGYYEYDYSGANDGINCSDASVTQMNRVMNDGTNTSTWQFSRSFDGTNWNTTVTAPQLPYDAAANQSVFTFNTSGQEITEKFYQGAATGTPLRTVNVAWATNGTPATRTTILEDGVTQNQVETTFDSNGNLLTLKEHDWGSGTPGTVLRTSNWTYLTDSAYTAQNIINRVTRLTVADSTGAVKSRTDIAYDESGYINSTCITGAVQHDDSGYSCTYTTRGSPTTVTSYTDPVTPAGAIAKHSYYDSLGNLVKADLNCCQQQQWSFSSTTNYAFPDSVVRGTSPTQLTSSATYNAYTGLVATSTDENGQVNTFGYDTMKRLVDVLRPDNAHLTWTYNDAVPPTQSSVTSTVPVQGTDKQKQITTVDGLGRPIKVQTTDAAGTSYTISETQYDPLGRGYKGSNPHNGTAQYWTETRFDALGRPTLAVPPDGSASTNRMVYSYATNTTTVTDQAGKARKTQADGLGRMINVWEPDVANGNALTQQTSYAYNVFDQLLTVSQGAQTRTYAYDPLGRLTDATTPEAGHFQYQYNSFNLLTQRTDARGVIAAYGYDTLNRLQTLSYNVGTTGVPATPSVSFTYGTSSAQNNNGRLLTMTDGPGSETYSYDILGRKTQCARVLSGTTYTTLYQYNLANELSQITYPSGRIVTQSFDGIGRLSQVASSGTSYVSGLAYSVAQQVTGFNYGNGVAASFGYSPDRLQLTSLSYAKGASTLLSLAYGYTQGGGNNGQITSITDNTGTQEAGRSVTYTYDALYRLSSAVTTGSASYPQWGLAWSYDRYGNRLSQTQTFDGPPTNSVGVSATTNHITDPGYAYDANGNMSSDGANTLVYDAENRLLSAANGGGSGTYSYDGNGLRVQKCAPNCTSPTSSTLYIFSGSKVVAEYDNGAAPASPSREYIYAGAQLVATLAGASTTYHHADHLSPRVNTDTGGNIAGQQGHFPFGENMYATGGTTTKWKFTSYERDPESANDYAMARSYANRLARFSSPDPLSGSLGDPQSLNRYSYTLSDPINFMDPSGLLANGPKVYQPAPLDWNMWLFELFIGGVFWDRSGERSFNGNFPWAALYYYTIFNSDINKTWTGTFPCNKNAQQLMSSVQNNMGRFADNRGTVLAANFPNQPLKMGGQYTIEPGLNLHTGDGSIAPVGTLVVTVTSQSANGWTFTTDPSHHYFNGTVSFSATNAGNGNVTFSVTANANFVNQVTKYTLGPLIKAGENSTWNNMLNNVKAYCQLPAGE